MPSKGFVSLLFNLFSYKFHFNLLTYWAIVGASLAFNYHRRFREEELQRAQLAGQLTLAQLQALKTQLHPHFLFNTLNTITAMIRRDPRRAEQMVARLGDLLRLTLWMDASRHKKRRRPPWTLLPIAGRMRNILARLRLAASSDES